jgi:UTP--glucose-1-phosphate uridylyltransferase
MSRIQHVLFQAGHQRGRDFKGVSGGTSGPAIPTERLSSGNASSPGLMPARLDKTTSTPLGSQDPRFEPFAQRMRDEGLPDLVISTFGHYYDELVGGATGLIGESAIQPVASVPRAEHLDAYAAAGRAALDRTVVLKLNGGLGTGMGLEKAKSLLPVKDGVSFLDTIAMQVLASRERHGVQLPLLLMNSFSTDADSLEALSRWKNLDIGMPMSFTQHKVPKVLQEGYAPAPASYGENAWCPPGHGDLYAALQTSGQLDRLLERGCEYMFVSNSDNLGAVLDERILGYLAKEKIPFLMEVADRTPADSKGGHLAMRPDGRLMLREVAQCPKEDLEAFSDINKHKFFNTNNIWIHLPSLKAALEARNGVLPLPLIRNSKTVDPRDANSPKVYQLETAMGAAIEVFDGAQALAVPRSRFAPVKATSDLLVVWSDAYKMMPGGQLAPNPQNLHGMPLVSLDGKHYKFVDQLQQRFPHGAPSLSQCKKLSIEGDVHFGRNVEIHGDVKIVNRGATPLRIPDGAVIDRDLIHE